MMSCPGTYTTLYYTTLYSATSCFETHSTVSVSKILPLPSMSICVLEAPKLTTPVYNFQMSIQKHILPYVNTAVLASKHTHYTALIKIQSFILIIKLYDLLKLNTPCQINPGNAPNAKAPKRLLGKFKFNVNIVVHGLVQIDRERVCAGDECIAQYSIECPGYIILLELDKLHKYLISQKRQRMLIL
jgi:hypothetical protein